jgi:hypothetical protein
MSGRLGTLVLCLVGVLHAQKMADHPAPDELGQVSFPVSCTAVAQAEFNRGIALLHSFEYAAAQQAFQKVAKDDPRCAMAHWGIAMTYFHQLWQPALPPESIPAAQRELSLGLRIAAPTAREQGFLQAGNLIFKDASGIPYPGRLALYEQAMGRLAAANRKDPEAQVFYALALLAAASPLDKSHARQKQAADLLEPLFQAYPLHPGITHYLIHAYDNAELAERGLPAARRYAKVAPSAPHALHMPSHIFTRLGLWDNSIASNTAARDAARRDGDTGEELHTMDYLVYAYLQRGDETSAAQVVQRAKAMTNLDLLDFKVAYATTAMPVRYAVERRQWSEAAAIVPPAGAPAQVTAVAVWARGLGLARGGHSAEARKPLEDLQRLEDELRKSGDAYWATQVGIMKRELMAWMAQSERRLADAREFLRAAAEQEDSVEKLPVTPGPIVPAREQFGELLLEQGYPDLASREFETALRIAPGRRGALQGAAEAARGAQH